MRSENEFLRAVEQQVREHPQAPAHKAPNGLTTTYAELWEASDRIAAALAARTEKRQPAVVLGHKSACMIAGFLGCLKSGHAFVPVDTEMPLTRLADILSQLGETLVVVTEDKDILRSEAFVSFHEFVRIPFFCFEEWKNILESHL